MYKYGLVHFTILFVLCYLYGFWGMIPALIILVNVADWVLDKLGYVRLAFMDLGCAYEIKCNANHVGGYIEIEKIDFEEFKNTFIERAVMKVRKLRFKLVKIIGYFLWKEVNICEAMDQIFVDNKVLKNHEEVTNYICELNSKKLDRSKPLWEIRFIENYSATTSLIIYIMHHSVIDGVGVGCLMSAVNDNQFTSKLNKEVFKPTLMQRLSIIARTPIVLGQVVPEMKKWCSDPSAAKLSEVNGNDHNANTYYATKEFSFKDVIKCYKRFPGMTFNDFMLAVISKSYDQWFKDHKIEDAKKIGFIIPVNLREMPTSYDDLIIDNNFASAKFELPISSDLSKTMNTIKPIILKMTAPDVLYSSLNLLKSIPYLPDVANLQMFDDFTVGCDASFSNISFSNVPWFIKGKRVTSMTFHNNTCLGITMAIMGYTYDGKVRFSLQTKKHQKLDSAKFMEYLVKNLDAEIAEVSK